MYKECLTKTIIMYKSVDIKRLAKDLATIKIKNRYRKKGLMDRFYTNNYDEFMSLKISTDANRDIEKSAQKYLEKIESVI